MIPNLPAYIPIIFFLTTALTLFLFLKAVKTPPQYKTVLGVLVAWLILQMGISWTGFYLETMSLPPRFALGIVPPLVAIIALFFTKSGQNFIKSLDLRALTLLHVVRIPVELVLFWLFQQGQIPEIMTFEGRNFDIFSGITAPFIVYFGFTKKVLSPKIIIAWNVLCLGLLVNIVGHAALSIASPFQQFGFEQPNRAVLYFPFIWLPSFIVPLVLLSHLVVLRQFFLKKAAMHLPKVVVRSLVVLVILIGSAGSVSVQAGQLTAPQRAFAADYLAKTKNEFLKSIEGLSEAQLNFKSKKEKWSIFECAEHIALAERRLIAVVNKQFKEPADSVKFKSLKMTEKKIIQRLTFRLIKVKAPEVIRPTGTFQTIQEIQQAFTARRDSTMNYAAITNDALHFHYWRHPATGTIDLYQTLILMAAHCKRHTLQIEEVKKRRNFPRY
jgi:DinB superfamily